MELNADFSACVALHAGDLKWTASPTPGVHRRMLDRIGDEIARATSTVRYDAGSAFPAHVHGGGEEFMVLAGVFQDNQGDYPAGCYVRNPPRSRHAPRSDEGCAIFVKLWQFDPADRAHVRIDTTRNGEVAAADRLGVSVTPLFRDAREDVRIERWEPGAALILDATDGAELFVLEGGFEESGEIFRRHSWLRVPESPSVSLTAGARGARVWIKSGHLRFAVPSESD